MINAFAQNVALQYDISQPMGCRRSSSSIFLGIRGLTDVYYLDFAFWD